MLRFLLIIAISLAVSGCFAVRGAKTLAPNWFGFVEISKDIYVDKAMLSSQRIEIIKTVRSAQARVSQFFGGLDVIPKSLPAPPKNVLSPMISEQPQKAKLMVHQHL